MGLVLVAIFAPLAIGIGWYLHPNMNPFDALMLGFANLIKMIVFFAILFVLIGLLCAPPLPS